jgi:benzodiazapine receptor
LRRLGYLFALSCVANAAWLFCWHYNQLGLSVLVMLSLLGLLIASYLRLQVRRTPVGLGQRWSVDIPFSLYLGWITVATVANITDWLYQIQWSGWGLSPQVWAVVMLAATILIGLGMALTRRDAAFLFVLVWALAGIANKQAATPLVAVSAWIAALLALGLALYSLFNRSPKPAHQ